MKIGIVSMFGNNYGNKLQNYAAVKIFTDMGYKVDTLVFDPKKSITKTRIKRIINKLSGCRLSDRQYKSDRINNFYLFDKKYLNVHYMQLDSRRLNSYTYFAIGSDQVWNPTWLSSNRKDAYFLTFAKPEQKVCMAPSIGLDELPDEWSSYFKEQLMTFPYLSVREESGAKIIKKLTGRDAEVVIDPTLMINASDWRKTAKKAEARKDGKPYILKYFLGDQDESNIKYINSIALKNNLEIHELLNNKDKKTYTAGPAEFIDLIEHAGLICTDSFHATVFSILFDKPFLVFDRKGKYENMGSRITGLLKMLGLEERLPGAVTENRVFEHNYNKAYKCLEAERKRAHNFLERSINKI